jgi:ParB/RepB/Spo0J family partition protein
MDSLAREIDLSSNEGSQILLREVEIHQLDLRYAHTRVITSASVKSLARSIEQFGQISPLVSVSRGSLVLIDGYRRVAALKLNGKDTAMAEVWPCTEREAILRLLVRSGARKWEAIEEAGLLRELLMGSDLTRVALARLVAKDPSWVTRRLDLLDSLDEGIIELVRCGRISSWAASRVLAPLARANTAHAVGLAGWIAKEGASTRDLVTWFRHYRKSNRTTREKMARDPSLFLKAVQAKAEQQEARRLRDGPEGAWLNDLGQVLKSLRHLAKEADPALGADLRAARAILTEIGSLILALNEQMERMENHDKSRNQTGDPHPPSEGNLHQQDRENS